MCMFILYVYFYVIVYISKPASIIITTDNGIQERDSRIWQKSEE
jgi:hypothetical protein